MIVEKYYDKIRRINTFQQILQYVEKYRNYQWILSIYTVENRVESRICEIICSSFVNKLCKFINFYR